ncbi:MAG TPA: CoA transferase [Candidatus Binataceae bacterium]|jgi:crotonobetainyl-CoA:carnitine CoA-transferase CaiB-like acyl-CoA transferase|nr:CoA transferase [Candidatus Binataceae bacterium]
MDGIGKEATGPLKGFKVVELAMWAAGPMVGGILADWGADVIKIEAADGDPFRALNLRPGQETVTETSIEFLVNNRGKRSIVLDVKTPEGRSIALELIHNADVFLTNLRSNALERMGLDYDTIHQLEPALIYCHVTGYGIQGEWRDRAAYDVGAFYARAGVAATLLPPGDEPMMRCGAFGDYYTAMSAAGGVCAALVARQQTGQGQRVVASLLRTGAYAISAHLDRVAQGSPPRAVKSRAEILNPMNNCYRDSRGKWFWLLGLQGDRMWPGVIRAIGRPELEHDQRFDTMEARAQNVADLTSILDPAFATRSLDEWQPVFEREDIWWTPVNDGDDLLKDPQMRAAGGLTRLPTAQGKEIEIVPAPIDFDATPWAIRGPAPEIGQHTEEILLEMGRDWDEIASLKDKRVI